MLAGEMYSTICVEWVDDYLDLVLTLIDPLSNFQDIGDIMRKHDY